MTPIGGTWCVQEDELHCFGTPGVWAIEKERPFVGAQSRRLSFTGGPPEKSGLAFPDCLPRSPGFHGELEGVDVFIVPAQGDLNPAGAEAIHDGPDCGTLLGGFE
jgi:hypothetical protein